jgi:hypothetical protein
VFCWTVASDGSVRPHARACKNWVLPYARRRTTRMKTADRRRRLNWPFNLSYAFRIANSAIRQIGAVLYGRRQPSVDRPRRRRFGLPWANRSPQRHQFNESSAGIAATMPSSVASLSHCLAPADPRKGPGPLYNFARRPTKGRSASKIQRRSFAVRPAS